MGNDAVYLDREGILHGSMMTMMMKMRFLGWIYVGTESPLILQTSTSCPRRFPGVCISIVYLA
ncbi:hypothetical protein CY34DRAFT_446453 [Suillus luteus UH-Slu-Lm8-n1]|uniref:Uncharacterized protein n=1 Tax=Suillus luteus UH-Slu-Lm8-n1 TaxID=930992 RepID=A0A0D0ATP3_9AGAM|nr:hypothetical protein CY34DRAFT_446453 [Suillus luteus UH-Slu-Lm8-n1]